MTRNAGRVASVRRVAAWASLLVALLAGPAWAGDRALIDIIGFSEDSRYFAFEEFGIQDGSGFAYSSVFVIDLSTDSWVVGTPLRAEAADETTPLAEIRAQALAEAAEDIATLGIDVPGELVAALGDGEPGVDGLSLSFGAPGYEAGTVSGDYQLQLSSYPTPSSAPCREWFSVEPLGYELSITDGPNTRLLHRDANLPRSRGCPTGYRLYGVVLPFNAGSIGDAVGLLSVYTAGFEGPTGASSRCRLASDPLSGDETRRYARHLVLKGMGGGGQQALKAARVLVVGAGGLGSPAIAYLAGAGIGTLGIADHDTVGLPNLQRQVIHTTSAIGSLKADSAAAFARALNPHVAIITHAEAIAPGNALSILGGYDLVLDGTDNLVTRRAVAEACAALGKPLVSGAVSMFDGQVTVFAPGGPRFADLYPPEADDADLPACEATGILGPLTGVIGTLMAMEAVKLVTGIGEPLVGRVLTYDSQGAHFSEFAL